MSLVFHCIKVPQTVTKWLFLESFFPNSANKICEIMCKLVHKYVQIGSKPTVMLSDIIYCYRLAVGSWYYSTSLHAGTVVYFVRLNQNFLCML